MFFSAKPITDIGLELQRHAHRLDRRALGRGLDHRRDVDVAEGRRAGGHRLNGDARAAAFLDVEVDAFLRRSSRAPCRGRRARARCTGTS